jgi:transposase-like protein
MVGIRRKRTYNKEFKLEAVRLVIEEGHSASSVERKLGTGKGVDYKWVNEHKRVERLMRINGIRSKRRRKFKVTTHSKHKRPVASNLIQRDFTAKQPDRLWTSDITYIRTREIYL